MKVLLYCDTLDKIVSDDTRTAIEKHVRELAAANIPYTFDPDDEYDIMEVNPAYLINPFPVVEARRKGVAVAVNAHYMKKENDGSYSFARKGSRFIKPVITAFLQKDDTIVLPSEYAAAIAENAGVHNNTEVIPQSVEPVGYIDKELFRTYFGVGDEKTVFGFGPMTAEYGFRDFINVAGHLPEYRFIWVGGASASEILPSSEDLRHSIPANMTCCELVTSEIFMSALGGSDILLYTRTSDGSYTDVLRGMAAGGYCILRSQALYSDFAKDGINCVLADSVDDIILKIKTDITKEQSSVRAEARRTAEDYSPYNIGQRYKAVYEDIMSSLVLNRIEAYSKAHSAPGKLNIGLFCETYPPDVNGVAVSVRTLRDQLISMGHNVYVITPALDTKLIGTEFKGGILRLPAIKIKKLYGYRLGRPYSVRAMSFIKKMDLDIVHNNGEFSMRLLAETVSRVYSIPLIYTYHTMIEDYTHYVDRGHFEETSKKIVHWYTRKMTECYDRLIAPTEKTRKILRGYGIEKPIDVIPTGIDTARFRPEALDGDKLSALKTSIGLDGHLCLCYVGRLAPEKNVDLIIDNIRKASESVKGLKLIITGYGPSEEELKEKVEAKGLSDIVIFTGKQKPDEIQYYFALGDVFVTASTSETQGLTYIEAMASGVPVIARFDECLDNVLIQGVTGFEFTDGDSFVREVVAFAELSTEKREELRKNVLAKAEEYSLRNFGVNILRSYYDTIRLKRAGKKIFDD